MYVHERMSCFGLLKMNINIQLIYLAKFHRVLFKIYKKKIVVLF